MYTIEEQERAAYSAGNTALAEALGARIDMQHALAADVVSIEELQSEIEHLKRILTDAREFLGKPDNDGFAVEWLRERIEEALAD